MLLATGLTTVVGVFAPLLQEYVLAPDAVRVTDEPAQTGLFPLTEIVGPGITVTHQTAEDLQLYELLPVTV